MKDSRIDHDFTEPPTPNANIGLEQLVISLPVNWLKYFHKKDSVHQESLWLVIRYKLRISAVLTHSA